MSLTLDFMELYHIYFTYYIVLKNRGRNDIIKWVLISFDDNTSTKSELEKPMLIPKVKIARRQLKRIVKKN